MASYFGKDRQPIGARAQPQPIIGSLPGITTPAQSLMQTQLATTYPGTADQQSVGTKGRPIPGLGGDMVSTQVPGRAVGGRGDVRGGGGGRAGGAGGVIGGGTGEGGGGTTETTECYPGFHWDVAQNKCVPTTPHCDPNFHWDSLQKTCVPDDGLPCQPGFHRDPAGDCIPDEDKRCEAGFHWDDIENRCIPDSAIQCPAGQHMENGVCVPDTSQTQPCSGGYRLADNPIAGGGGQEWVEEGLPPGWRRDDAAQGHQIWNEQFGFQDINDVKAGKTLTPNPSGACRKGFTKEIINGEEFCCPGEGDFDGGGDGGDGGLPGITTPTGALGEYQLPGNLQGLYDALIGRAGGFLDRPTGYTPEAKGAMFGRDFEGVRDRERAQRETLGNILGTQGMRGTGQELDVMKDLAWGTERGISDLQRDLFVKGEEKEKEDILDYTTMAQSLFGGGLGTEQLIEAINAGRRGEGSDALTQLLMLLGLFS